MGLIGGMARTAVVAGTATAVSNRVSRRQAARWGQQDQAQYEQQYQEPAPVYQQAPPPPQAYEAPPAPEADKYEQLKELADLKAAGVLTEQEFNIEKAKILNS